MRLIYSLLFLLIHAVSGKELYTAKTFEYLGILSPENDWNGAQVVDWNVSKASRVLMDIWEDDAQFEISIGDNGCVYDGSNTTLIACFDSESNLELTDDDDEALELRETCKQVGKSGGFELRLSPILDSENYTRVQYHLLNMDNRTHETLGFISIIKFADAGNTECRDVKDFTFIEYEKENTIYTILLYCIHTNMTESHSRTFDIYLYPQMCEPMQLAKPDHLIAKAYFGKETIANCTRSDETSDICKVDFSMTFDQTTLYPQHGVKYPTSAEDTKLFGGPFFTYNVIKEKAMSSWTKVVSESVEKIARDKIHNVSDELISIFTIAYNDHNISAVKTFEDKCRDDFHINESEYDIIKERLPSVIMVMDAIRTNATPFFDESAEIFESNVSACFKSSSSDFGKEIAKAIIVSAPISDTERVKVAKKAGKDCGYDICKGINWPAENVTDVQITLIGRYSGQDVYYQVAERKWNDSEAAEHNDTNNVYGVWMDREMFDWFTQELFTFYQDLGEEFAEFLFQRLYNESSHILAALVGEEVASRVGDQLNQFIAKDLEKEVETQKPVEKILGAMRDRLKVDFDALFTNDNSSESMGSSLEFLRNTSFTATQSTVGIIKREPIPYKDMVRQFVYVFHGVQFHMGFVQGYTDNPDALQHAVDMCLAKSKEPTFCER